MECNRNKLHSKAKAHASVSLWTSPKKTCIIFCVCFPDIIVNKPQKFPENKQLLIFHKKKTIMEYFTQRIFDNKLMYNYEGNWLKIILFFALISRSFYMSFPDK